MTYASCSASGALSSLMLFVLLSIILSPSAGAQLSSGIIGDRPGQLYPITEPGMVQVAAGMSWEYDYVVVGRANRSETTTLVPVQLYRLGMTDNAEMRIGAEYVEEFTREIGTTSNAEGIRSISIGGKMRVLDQEGSIPEFSIFGNLRFPLGLQQFRPYGITPGLQSQLDYNFDERVMVTANVGGEYDFFHKDILASYVTTVAMPVTERIGVFGDLFGQMSPRLYPVHSFDLGVTYLVWENLQFDGGTGMSFTKSGPDYFVSGGLSLAIRTSSGK